jgi:hypothetical protein
MLDPDVEHDMEQAFALHYEIHCRLHGHFRSLLEAGVSESMAWDFVQAMERRLFAGTETVYIDVEE